MPNEFNLIAVGFEQVTGLNTAKGLTVPEEAKYALIQTESQAVRWRQDGTVPTAAVGLRLLTTDSPQWFIRNLESLRFIEEAASAKLNVQYFK